jgi:hypothetical protein
VPTVDLGLRRQSGIRFHWAATVLPSSGRLPGRDIRPRATTRVLTGGHSGPGSYLVIARAGTADEAYGQTKRTAGARACRNASSPIIFRTREQFAAVLTGLDLVEPGLVALTDWHPESDMTSLATSDGD